MKYRNIIKGHFLSRPNRFIAYVEIAGKVEKVHVKNTGRCRNLLTDNAIVYLEKAREGEGNKRSTAYDLVAVEKAGELINMDSQAPNAVVYEWLRDGGFPEEVVTIKPESVFGDSRFDFYIETKAGRKGFIEVKGVTLEKDGVAQFPDAPSDRAVKHLQELEKAREAGYDAFLIFVVQMNHIRYVVPHFEMQPLFADTLAEVKRNGVKVLAYDCHITEDELRIRNPLPVYTSPIEQLAGPLLEWYDGGRRILPWRENPTPYHVWVSEIMLQQTRVEAVKPYYDRFLEQLPSVQQLADASEEKLLKLWEGLGYYNRVRNMQKAAQKIMDTYRGEMPAEYEQLCDLPGIGSYTAGAIASIAFGKALPAVDGNVLRVVSRVLMDDRDILSPKVKKSVEQMLYHIIPQNRPGDFNQAMMELGAMVCLPNGKPKCENCPLQEICRAYINQVQSNYPNKTPGKKRRIEKKTVLVLQDDEKIALHKRPQKGLLAGMYEFPCLEGELSEKEVLEYLKSLGFPAPIRIKKLPPAKHIFTHKEWHMLGYAVWMDQLFSGKKREQSAQKAEMVFVQKKQVESEYPIPSAYATYTTYLDMVQGAKKYKRSKD